MMRVNKRCGSRRREGGGKLQLIQIVDNSGHTIVLVIVQFGINLTSAPPRKLTPYDHDKV